MTQVNLRGFRKKDSGVHQLGFGILTNEMRTHIVY